MLVPEYAAARGSASTSSPENGRVPSAALGAHRHQGPAGEQRYRDVLLDHYQVDTASVRPHTLRFLIDQMGEERVVFGSDYCGGLGPLRRSLPVLDEQPDPARVRALTARNSARLLGL